MTWLLYYRKCQSRTREIIQSNIYRNLLKVNQVTYTLDTMCMSNFMILFQTVLQIFCWQCPLWVKCLSQKRGIVLHHVLKLYDWCHNHSSSGSPDILLTRLLYYTKCWSRKREIIQWNIHRILPYVNQVIYALDTICEPNIILAQSIL